MLERILAAILLAAAVAMLFWQEDLLYQQYQVTAGRILCEPILTKEAANAGI